MSPHPLWEYLIDRNGHSSYKNSIIIGYYLVHNRLVTPYMH